MSKSNWKFQNSIKGKLIFETNWYNIDIRLKTFSWNMQFFIFHKRWKYFEMDLLHLVIGYEFGSPIQGFCVRKWICFIDSLHWKSSRRTHTHIYLKCEPFHSLIIAISFNFTTNKPKSQLEYEEWPVGKGNRETFLI